MLCLPFMEQQALLNSFDLTQFISAPRNEAPRGVVVPALLCPSDGNNRVKFQGLTSNSQGGGGPNWARGNYGAQGEITYGTSTAFKDQNFGGVMGWNASLGLRDILDGTSNTLMVVELRSGVTERDRRGTWAMGVVGASATMSNGRDGDAAGPNVCSDNSDDIEDCSFLYSNPGSATMLTECMSCWPTCDNHQATTRSKHPGGVIVACADASVHFISDNIETGGQWYGPSGGAITAAAPLSVWDRFCVAADGVALDMSKVFAY
jgi:hypothetical protein